MKNEHLTATRLGALTLALGWAGLLGSMCASAYADNTAATGASAGATSAHSPTRAAAKRLTRKLPGHGAVASPGPAAAEKVSRRSGPKASRAAAPTAAATSSGQGSNYDQLHRNVVISADIYGGADSTPRILAANYGFEGIQGIPGLVSESQIALAVNAGAGVVGQLVGLDPAAPFRNITSGASPVGIQSAGFSNTPVTETFMDAMPIEFSHPVLPGTVLPENFRVTLNNGDMVTPYYVAQTPNYDFNERQTIVAFGDFGNRLPTDDPSAVYPVLFEVVASATPLKLITPKGLVDGTGLSASSSNPYDPFSGPTLVGAKLSRLSLAGDYPPSNILTSVGNHGVEYYGPDPRLYRLRLFTSGGFSPNGVSGFEPQDFAEYFQLTAAGPCGTTVTISRPDIRYRVKGGYIEVRGIADLGTGLTADPEYTYSEDHDNQFDIVIWASSALAARSITDVVLPDPRLGTHSPIYNPGGPGTVAEPGYRFTTPSPGQTMPVELALRDPATVSWADQSLSSYDQASDLAVAFRLQNASTGEWLLTSSSADATSLVDTGEWALVDVPFATNPDDSYVVDVVALHNDQRQDTVYTANTHRIDALERSGYVNEGTAFTAYDKPLRGLDPVWQMVSPRGQHAVTSSPGERLRWLLHGWRPQGVAFFTVSFPNA